MLKKNEVAFKPEYLFDFFDDIDWAVVLFFDNDGITDIG
jgi:hypothetical protein